MLQFENFALEIQNHKKNSRAFCLSAPIQYLGFKPSTKSHSQNALALNILRSLASD